MNIQPTIQQRIFLVGCPRSGTTLLQSLLAAHPQIASFPESHFFKYLTPSRPWMRSLGIASRWVQPRLKEFLQEIGQEIYISSLPKNAIFRHQYVKVFIEFLDTLTVQQNKTLWLEKTPEHLHYIDYIEKVVPGAKFIHIIRNGSDVVASLYEVTRKYSHWGKVIAPQTQKSSNAWEIDRCIHQWIQDTKMSYTQLNKPNHILVKYEQLVDDPYSILMKVCKFIEVEFSEELLKKYCTSAQQLILEREPWKLSVTQPIKSTNSTKFYSVFTEEQRQYILSKLRSKMDFDCSKTD